MVIFEKKIQNLIKKNTLKRTKLHRFKKISRGSMPSNPLAIRMASPCAACCFATCKFPNVKIKFLAPPSQILGTPLKVHPYVITYGVCLFISMSFVEITLVNG